MFSDLTQRIYEIVEGEEATEQLKNKILQEIAVGFIEERLNDILPEEFPVKSLDVSSILKKLVSKINPKTRCDKTTDDSINSNTSKLKVNNQNRKFNLPSTSYNIQLPDEVLKKYGKLFKIFITVNNDNFSEKSYFENLEELILSTEIIFMNRIKTMKNDAINKFFRLGDYCDQEYYFKEYDMDKIENILVSSYIKWRNSILFKDWDKDWQNQLKVYLREISEKKDITISRQAEDLTNEKIKNKNFLPKPFPNLKSWRDLTLTLKYINDDRLKDIKKWKIVASFDGKKKKYTIKEFYNGKRKKLNTALLALSLVKDGNPIPAKEYATKLKIKPTSIKSKLHELCKILMDKFGIKKRPFESKKGYIYFDLKIKYNPDYNQYESNFDSQGFKKKTYRDNYQENINHDGEDSDNESSSTLANILGEEND